jgi:membrane protein DedA with SNARE-associated domain
MFDYLIESLSAWGYFGITTLMFLENVFPPIPSELIMPMGGFAAARGELNGVGVLLAGVTGSLLGALPWYFLGQQVGLERLTRWAERHGRWLTISPQELNVVTDWFKRHGGKAVFFGRLMPTFRTLIALPAGIMRMPLNKFLMLSALGSILWCGVLTTSGYLLESQYQLVADVIDPITKGILILLVLGYGYRVVTYRQANRS